MFWRSVRLIVHLRIQCLPSFQGRSLFLLLYFQLGVTTSCPFARVLNPLEIPDTYSDFIFSFISHSSWKNCMFIFEPKHNFHSLYRRHFYTSTSNPTPKKTPPTPAIHIMAWKPIYSARSNGTIINPSLEACCMGWK